MLTTAFLISAFTTLFVVIDPIGLVPMFIVTTQGHTDRAKIALRACLIAAAILTLFGFLGDAILGFVGITLPAFRIAGGILLFLTALDMLFDRRIQRRDALGRENLDAPPDPSVFPLATPLIAGPGAITTMILLIGQAGNDLTATLAVVGLMVSVVSVVFLLFLTANRLERALGRIGTLVVSRLLGMLLAALAVQFVLDGLRGAGVFG